MEDVWKNMTSLITNIKTNHQGPLLQDFLPGGVFYKGSPLPDIINCDSSQTSSGDVNCNNGNLEVMCSLSGSKVCCDKVGVVDERKKMDHDQDLSNIGSRAARRRRRLIKNRESAARSRARKQAYTEELEKAVTQLLEENEQLKREREEMRLEIGAQLSTKAISLQRSSTAPF
ncbi:Basic-leucine zipper domain-containing protein [Dioscorea alata]|uniref:Basic-leucine zipper domain-containing protein n=1 Tax=Dioscorea alata TaxID=55571 RepID=A0ACB7WUE6_DIOAL|nr:Basic-leucine zipper domain-containing protein [Dioscorea alata]